MFFAVKDSEIPASFLRYALKGAAVVLIVAKIVSTLKCSATAIRCARCYRVDKCSLFDLISNSTPKKGAYTNEQNQKHKNRSRLSNNDVFISLLSGH
jgi:hypothetical protein